MSEIQKYEQPSLAVRDQVNQIQALMKNALQDGTHYGTVPGCGKKPTLLLPGAEKIALMFGWSYDTVVDQRDLDGGHREYTVTVKLIDRKTGQLMGTGIGLCTTMESKYRYRRDKRTNKRSENPDIADVYNTVLKMAKKRALVDAVKSTAAASDIFTQDIEDMGSVAVYEVPNDKPPAAQPDRLQPVRDLLRDFCSATGYTPAEAASRLCIFAGVRSMQEVEDVPAMLDYMRETIDMSRQQKEELNGIQG